MISLSCDSGAEITLRLDLFEDVLSGDWIYPDCSRERERERERERLKVIRLHFRLRLLSVSKPTSMQGGEWDALKHSDAHSFMNIIYLYHLFIKKWLLLNFPATLNVQLQMEQRGHNMKTALIRLLKMKNAIQTPNKNKMILIVPCQKSQQVGHLLNVSALVCSSVLIPDLLILETSFA